MNNLKTDRKYAGLSKDFTSKPSSVFTSVCKKDDNMKDIFHELLEELDEYTNITIGLMNDLKQRDKTIDSLDLLLANANEENLKLKQRLQCHNQENSKLKEQILGLNDEIDQLQGELRDKNNQLTEMVKLLSDISDKRKKFDSRELLIAELNSQLKSKKEEVKHLKNKLYLVALEGQEQSGQVQQQAKNRLCLVLPPALSD